jgi:hypothetical protein
MQVLEWLDAIGGLCFPAGAAVFWSHRLCAFLFIGMGTGFAE